jgi:TonB family protein
MKARRWLAVPFLAVVLARLAPVPHLATTQARALDPIVYTIRFPDPASKTFTVEAVVPTDNHAVVDLMMPVWSPGFYGLQNYADRVSTFSATAAGGVTLDVARPQPNRWEVTTGGRSSFTATYTVAAPRGSNLSNGVTETSAVLIGPATYVTLVDPGPRPAEVHLELPAAWAGSMTSLDAASDGQPNHYVAPDYDVLADSPILAGVDLSTTEFTVGGVRHYWVWLGHSDWPGDKVAAELTPLIEEHLRFWGSLPYKKYAFLDIITGGGGGSGVEHLNSVAITGGGKEPADQTARFRNAAFISHEYFHAMNVKRLRPVELGPFDYEHAPTTTGLWVAEGLTSYFGDLLSARAGLGSTEDYLNLESRHITDLQTKQPGRLVQTLEQASAQMFERIPADQKVDYYIKGPVVGLVMDAHIRHLTNGGKSMDDVMRLEYQRWSGAHGYTADEFAQTMSDAAGIDTKELLHRLVATTEEVDYSEMLEWFGLRFMTGDPAKAWTLEIRPDQTPTQQEHLSTFLAHSHAQGVPPGALGGTVGPAVGAAPSQVPPGRFGEGAYTLGRGAAGPTVIKNVQPVYPESGRVARTQGSVTVEAIIGKDGRIRDERVLRSLGPDFDQAAVAALKQWTFAPTLLNGEPIELLVSVVLTFTLR